MTNPIESFEFILREHSSRHLALYNDNKQNQKQSHTPQDVISSVSAQLQAIQAADSLKNNKCVNKDLHKFRNSVFLCVNKLPVYEEAPKQTNTFDTQFVSNTQLINIIEDAELIDNQRGMTQEFETSFSHTDKLNRLVGGTSMPHNKDSNTQLEIEIHNINEIPHSGSCKEIVEDIVTKDGKYSKYCFNAQVGNDDGTNRTYLEEKFNKNRDSLEKMDTDTHKNIKNKFTKDRIDLEAHKICKPVERITKKNDIIDEAHIKNCIAQNLNNNIGVISKEDDYNTFLIDESIDKNKVFIKESNKNIYKDINLSNNIEICKGREMKHKNTANNEKDILLCEEMEEDINEMLNECIEIDVNTARSPSPVFLIKKDNIKSKSPSPLVVDLETFEQFENFAISLLEHNDFEKAKHLINSQILGKELHFKTDEDVELESKDGPPSPVLRVKTSLQNIQGNSSKNEKETIGVDFLIEKHPIKHFNKQFNTESQQLDKIKSLEDKIFNSTKENNVDTTTNPNDPIFSLIESAVLSQILPVNIKKKATKIYKNNDKHNTTYTNKLSKDENPKFPKLDQSNINILNDEMLFSSDEEDMDRDYKDLPFTCAGETSFDNKGDVLDKTMYVGFQTASNKSIQICKDSFDKARSLLSGVDCDETTVTELVKICDDSNRDINTIKFKESPIENEITAKEAILIPGNIATKESRLVTQESSNYHKITAENNNNFDGFKTASNKVISLSDKALARSKKVFQDINLDEKYDTQTNIDTKDTVIKTNFQNEELNDVNFEMDFKETDVKAEELGTADLDDLIYNINDEVIIKEFENIEMSLEEEIHKDEGFVGFKIASDKNTVITDEALTKTKKIFKDIDMNERIDENYLKYDNNEPDLAALSTIKIKVDPTPRQNIAQIRKEDRMKTAISYTDFKTANNKVINISKEALAKTNHIFKDIDSVQLKENPNMDTGANVNKKDVYPNIDDFNQPSTSRVTFAGFKTGNNKEIKISNASLAKVKDIFKDIDYKEEELPDVIQTPAIKASFPGFKTGNDKEIKASSSSLTQVKAIFKDMDIFNVEPYAKENKIKIPDTYDFNKPSTNTASFKTANNRGIKITEAALTKTRNIFNDIDSMTMPRKPHKTLSKEHINAESLHCTEANTTCFVGFKTANNKEIRISEAAIAKTKNIFNDIDDIANQNMIVCTDLEGKPEIDNLQSKQIPTGNFEDVGRENNPKVIPKNNTFQGFKTASNKQVVISREALSKTKNIFKDIGTDDKFNIEAEKLRINTEKSSSGTATDNVIDAPKDDLEKGSVSTFKGFQTASNKVVPISEEALARSRNIFKELDSMKNVDNNVLEEDTNDKTEFIGFQTGTNKVINISEKALMDSRKLLEDSAPFIGFQTASDRKVSISQQTLEKTRTVFQDTVDVDERDGRVNNQTNNTIEFVFKTANNQSIKVSENALAKSNNTFENNVFKVSEKGTSNVEDTSNIIDTQVLNNFEETLYTEDFKATPIKSKRSGSPILSCPRAKKRKKFEAPYSQKPVKNIMKHDIAVTDTTKLKFDDTYKKNKLLKLKDLQKYADANAKIDPYLIKHTYDNLLQFEFIDKRNDLSNNKITIESLRDLFLDSVNAKLVPEGWIENHLRLILWKLISYEIRFPDANVLCSTTNVLNQLKYRYDRELYNAQRPALRKIFERDDLSTKTIVLCVVQIYEDGVQVKSVTNLTSNIELLLTDGWYCIKASTDRMIAKLVYGHKIVVGTKIVTNGAELMNCDQGMSPWEDTSSVRLKLFGNSTRRARWDARLGYHGNAAILSHLSTVNIDGGRVSKLRVYVTRVYPSLYVEKFEDGSTVTRSERLEHLHQMKYETERQRIMEKLYEEVEKEFSDQESQDSEGYSDSGGKRTCLDSGTQIAKIMRKSNDPAEFRAQLTSSQSILLANHTEKRREKLLQDVEARIREKMEKSGMCVTRNVVPVKKIRVAGLEEKGDTVEVTKGMVSIWKPNEAILEIINEGCWIDVMNVVPTAIRYSEFQISAGRQSVFSQSKFREPDKFKTHTKLLKRKCFTIKDLAHNPTMNTDYNEIDTVGLVFLIDPSILEFESTKQLFQNVYFTDGDKNIVCVNFWGGLKKFGFDNVLDTGQIVMCGNLQKRAGNTRKNIPQYRVTEFSYFTKLSKNENARIILEELNKIFISLDRRKFCDDCIVLKNNYSVTKNYNNENISPYRPNNSDLNISKNKQFIDSPLVIKDNFNLTGLDFESTFKQTDSQDLSKELLLRKKRVNDKITRLKMYGEPPPLSCITILNKSKNAFNSYKSPLLSELSISTFTSSRIPNLKSDSCTNVASSQITPQKGVALNNFGHSSMLDQTYVKSVNPVKLNFNENNDSDIDHFAEEFDGSPPLSLE